MQELYQAAGGMDRLTQMASGDTWAHRLNPMAKVIVAAVFVVAIISFPSRNVSGLVPLFFYPMIMMILAGIPFSWVFKRVAVALPFCLAGGISNVIFMRDTAFYMMGVAISFGVVSCVSILFKTVLTVSAILVLMATTDFGDLGVSMVRLGVPKVFCMQLLMTYRYISVLLREAMLMYTAYMLRGGDGKGIQMKHMGSFLGQLILRSFDRAERVYMAMKCRGFSGVYVSGESNKLLRTTDVLFVVFIVAAVALLRFFNFSLFLGNFVGG